ncbi:MAG: trypsin-like peptidase domain-containing protein [Candidatus Bathyarchaeia archaeon]
MAGQLGASNNQFKIVLTTAIISCLLLGGTLGYVMSSFSNSGKIIGLEGQLANLQNQLSTTKEDIENLQKNVRPLNIATDQNSTVASQNITVAINYLQQQLSDLQTRLNSMQAQLSGANQNATAFQEQLISMNNQLLTLQQQISRLQEALNSTPATSVTYQNITYVTGENVSLSALFERVKESVVVVQGLVRQVDFFGRIYYSSVQGSGFVYDYGGRMLILTNNHVISGTINITVTFTTGEVYAAMLVGANPNNDFAVLSINESRNSYKPLEIISSSTLKVGDPVVVVGTPYGLAGSMSNGIVSALNRTLTTSTQSTIGGVIQTTAPLNPGNSGGPLMNYQGQVVGIATAIAQESQGIGFAIPSDTMLEDLSHIVTI